MGFCECAESSFGPLAFLTVLLTITFVLSRGHIFSPIPINSVPHNHNFNDPEKEVNMVGKGENTGKQHFLLPSMFSIPSKTKIIISATFIVVYKCFQFDLVQNVM